MGPHLQDLIKDYAHKKIVPFIGAGFSVPFNVPTWKDLIERITAKYATGNLDFLKQAVEMDLNRNDYWGAIDSLKKFAPIIDQDIQEEIVELIEESQIKINDPLQHNYSDLENMNFNLYLTTNYENLLNQYLKYEIQPILLKDIEFSTQNIFEEKRVCHLHGTLSNNGTIVISRESYNKLYENKKYNDLLKLATGSKKVLFMGFSFDDQFISTLIKDHKESFKGNHYILLADPPADRVRELRIKYGLHTIPYTTKGSSHVIEIRKILNKMANTTIGNKVENADDNNIQSNSNITIGAGLKDLKKNKRENLFYRKLELENIDESIIKLSSAFFVAAEEYIREIKKVGMKVDVIDAILAQVFIEYQELYVDAYKEHGNSEVFLKVVHDSLEKIDFGRHNLLLKNNKTNKHENRGFVHILADDSEQSIWWGDGRFDETSKE